MNVCMHVYVCIVYVACGDQKRALHPLLLELGIQPGSSVRTTSECSLAPQQSLQAHFCSCLFLLGFHYVA